MDDGRLSGYVGDGVQGGKGSGTSCFGLVVEVDVVYLASSSFFVFFLLCARRPKGCSRPKRFEGAY